MKDVKEPQDPHSVTQPVILIGVDRQNAPDFKKLLLIVEENGVQVIENHYFGIVSVEMRNDQLVVYVSNEKKD
mgnify:CR=1 FL=1|tara:strand:- start:2388 stop:2606 length:219 start_codon:yes stop_codon:yes gene_type:complete